MADLHPVGGPKIWYGNPDIHLYFVADPYPPRRGWLPPGNTTFPPGNSLAPKTCPAMRTRDIQLGPKPVSRSRRPPVFPRGERVAMGKLLLAILSSRGAHPGPQVLEGVSILRGLRSLAITMPETCLAERARLPNRHPLADHAGPLLGFPPRQTLPTCGG
jgi:hypothetical protein